jgi:hypothetical protein
LVFVVAAVGSGLLALALQPTTGPRGVAVGQRNAGQSLTPRQLHLLSGGTERALLSLGLLSAQAASHPDVEIGEESASGGIASLTPGGPVAGTEGHIFPNSNGLCLVTLPNNNIRATTECLNATDPGLHGRGQAHNETAIAANPSNPNQVIAGQNDYRRGDGACGSDFSADGGLHWGSALAPHSFILNGAKRMYFQAAGDTSVAWDSHNTAYLSCGPFNRGPAVSENTDRSNALLVFRSDNAGASWNFPGGVVASRGPQPTQLPLLDKQYLAIDNNTLEQSPFSDRLYVTWTEFKADGTANIYISYSSNAAKTWSAPTLVSGDSNLCDDNPGHHCFANQFSEPVVAPNGDLFVIWANFNNAVTGSENRNMMLLAKSTDGGVSFDEPRLVSYYYDLPDCYTYTGQDRGRACVPVKASTAPADQPSVFRAANYPSAVVDPTDSSHVIVHFGSYINPHSRESNAAGAGHCAPAGLVPPGSLNEGNNLFTGVNTVGGCNNDILVSESFDGGQTYTGSDPRTLPSVNQDSTFTDQFWQWSAIDANGHTVVMFYDRQYGNDESNGYSDISIVFATTESRVTGTSMPPPTQFANAFNHGEFMGDYSGLTMAGNVALPFWTDTRDVGITTCPANPRQLCTMGNQQDVFVARITSPL